MALQEQLEGEKGPFSQGLFYPLSSGPAPLLLTLSKASGHGWAEGKQSCWAKGVAAAWSPPGHQAGRQPASVRSFLEEESTIEAPGEHEKSQEQSVLIFRLFGASVSMLLKRVIWRWWASKAIINAPSHTTPPQARLLGMRPSPFIQSINKCALCNRLC